MKKMNWFIKVLFLVFGLCLVIPMLGFAQSFEMGPQELELANQILIDNGYKNLVPIKGIMRGSGDLVLICARSNGGTVRVEVKWDKNTPKNKVNVKVFE